MMQQQQVLGTGSPIANLQGNNSAGSVDSQTQQILRQIQESLRKSQAAVAVSSPSPLHQTSVVNQPSLQGVTVKQEPMSTSFTQSSFVPSATVKKDTNLLENLIKQEDVKPNINSSSMASSIHALLTNSGSGTQSTTTLSQATTQMSLFVLSNSSQNMLSNTSTISSGVMTNTATHTISSSGAAGEITSPVQGNSQQPAGGALQKLNLSPELQQQFQRLQLQIRKVQASTNMSVEQKQQTILKLQSFQKHILLKSRVSQLQQAQSAASASPLPTSTAITEQASSVPSSNLSTPVSSSPNFLQATLAQVRQNMLQQAQSQQPNSSSSTFGKLTTQCHFIINTNTMSFSFSILTRCHFHFQY